MNACHEPCKGKGKLKECGRCVQLTGPMPEDLKRTLREKDQVKK